MDFELSADQIMLRDMVRRLVNDRITPRASEWSHDGAWPTELKSELAELGLLAVMVDPEWDGAGFGPLELAVVVKELARGDGGLAMVVASHNLASAALATGKGELQSRWLRALVTGDTLGGWVGPVGCHEDGGEWVLEGQATGVQAELLVIDAGDAGFVLEASALESALPVALGLRSAARRMQHLDGVRVGADNHLGQLSALAPLAHLMAAAVAVGVGKSALVAAKEYANERKQFGTPLATFQAIQWKLADAATSLEAAELLLWRAALCVGEKRSAHQSAMAYLAAARAARRAADEAVQIHGGFGFAVEFPVERYYRDACELGFGADVASARVAHAVQNTEVSL